MKSNEHSPFNWKGKESAFMKDKHFNGTYTKTSERATVTAETAVNLLLKGGAIYTKKKPDVLITGGQLGRRT